VLLLLQPQLLLQQLMPKLQAMVARAVARDAYASATGVFPAGQLELLPKAVWTSKK